MRSKEDAYSAFDPILLEWPLPSPWDADGEFRADLNLLAKLLAFPIAAGHGQESGRFAKAIDAWMAHELRRSGFEKDEVWPRSAWPRVLPRELSIVLQKAPANLRLQLERFLGGRGRGLAPVEARILGSLYTKQVDVLIASWDRGAELIVSTKSILSSFWNNLRNRYEEEVGNRANLRGRFPLAALGSLYIVRSTILEERGALEFLIDMMRSLRGDQGYDATCAIVAEWAVSSGDVRLIEGAIPPDLAPGPFLGSLVNTVLSRTPVSFHVEARELAERRQLPVPKEDEPGVTPPGTADVEEE